jgi:hypothetical protein
MRRYRRYAAPCLLGVWAVVFSLVVATFMAGHWSTLPSPDARDPALAIRVGALRTRPGWLAVHVLSVDCRCSHRVLDHLLATARPPGLSEIVVLIGDDAALRRRVTDAGFVVRVLTAAALEKDLGIVAAPLFVVADPQDAIRYAGGYTSRKQAVIHDVEIVRALMAGRHPDALAVFGCGVSDALRRRLDPLGVKYR